MDRALAAFRALLGDSYVATEAAALEPYGQCTTPTGRRIAGVIRPASVDDVQEIVRIATEHRVPLYPVSTGKNWGYGSALPARHDNIIVDLGRMNRIVEVNRDLAYAVVEPGVTQRQLYEHLQERGVGLWLSPTGAGPDCSVLGNTLERGFSIGPNGDHFLAQCGMEVVLGTGELLRTGFGHYDGAKATYVYKWGVGPYVDGLFTQSSYGIVTKMGVWLWPEPDCFEACYFTANSEEQLPALIAAVRRLLFMGVFQGPMNLLHRNRVLIMLGRYPWEEMANATPLSEAVAARLAAEKRIGAWNGVGAISGSRAQIRAARTTIRQVLGTAADRVRFLSDDKLRWLQRFPAISSGVFGMNVPQLLRTLEGSYGLLKGVPTRVALALAYWRNKRPPAADGTMNPARDHCGLMWFAPVIPITDGDVRAFRGIVDPLMARFGFESCITFTAVNQRSFDCTLPLLYDKDNPEETERARQCYDALVDECARAGYFAYRLGLQTMDDETGRDDVFWKVSARLKRALDPEGVLAPGRYSPAD